MWNLTDRKRIRLGFAPTRRVLNTPKAFNKEEAKNIKDKIESRLKDFDDIEIVNLDFLNEEGLLYDTKDAARVADRFIQEKVDAVFTPHCNFGSEEAVAKVAQLVGKPVLLWGPRDDSPDEAGDRLRDTQCGMFATSRVLRQFQVKYTYITNCALEDEKFERGFLNFLGAVSVVKAMTHLRIGQIGTRPNIFWSVKTNELELMERFGIEIVPVTMVDLNNMLKANLEEKRQEIEQEAAKLAKRFIRSKFTMESWRNMANLILTIRTWAEEEQLSAVAAQCWRPMDSVAGVAPCLAFSELTGAGLPVICESDIHGAISSVIALAATRWNSRTFLADLTIRHPSNDNAELLWHCGVFPYCLARDTASAVAEKHFNRQNPAVGHWELQHGDLTIIRFDGLSNDYSCLFGHAHGVDGPATFGTYLWAEFVNWPQWERRFIEGPYIHHCVGTYGKVAPVIWEACKYIPNLKADPVRPTEEEIEEYLL